MANAPSFKVTIRYIQYNRTWNEDFWWGGSNIGSLVAAVSNILSPATAFRHPSTYINYVRITNPFAQRQSQILHQSIPILTPGNIQPEVTSTAAIYRMNTENLGVSRSIWARGLPNASVARRPGSGQDYPAGTLDAGMQAFFTALQQNGFGILSLVPVDSGDNKRHPISSITVNANKTVTVNTPDTYVTQTPARVVLYRIPQKLFPALKGHFTIIPAVGNFLIEGYSSPLAAGDYPLVGAAFRQELYRFSAFIPNLPGTTNNCQFVEFDRRDTAGGPSSTRGRSRTAIRRSA